jgi:hypothetical protein
LQISTTYRLKIKLNFEKNVFKVGVDDAIAVSALLYSQFFKLERKTW